MRDDQVQIDFYQRMRASIRAWLEHKGKGFIKVANELVGKGLLGRIKRAFGSR
jgi:hypothetical protein